VLVSNVADSLQRRAQSQHFEICRRCGPAEVVALDYRSGAVSCRSTRTGEVLVRFKNQDTDHGAQLRNHGMTFTAPYPEISRGGGSRSTLPAASASVSLAVVRKSLYSGAAPRSRAVAAWESLVRVSSSEAAASSSNEAASEAGTPLGSEAGALARDGTLLAYQGVHVARREQGVQRGVVPFPRLQLVDRDTWLRNPVAVQ